MKISIVHHLVASPGAEGFVDVYTVDPARKLTTVKTQVGFPIGVYGELLLALYYGEMKVIPKGGYWTGDGLLLVDETRRKWHGGDKVRLYYKNENATETREAFILILAELE